MAVLLSTHDVNPLMGAMDRLVYLARGRAASGPAADVIRTAVLSALYGHHVDVLRVHGRVVVVAGDGTPHAHGAESAIPRRDDPVTVRLAPGLGKTARGTPRAHGAACAIHAEPGS